MYNNNSIRLQVSGLALALAALSPAAHAQDNTTPDNTITRILDTVTVTVSKKADVENVQDVPVAVTAFNADTLDALKVRDIEGLSYSSPNVSLSDVGTTRGAANFSIRGLGVNSSIPSIDPTVGVFIDGVYLGMNNGVVFDLFDLDSVEIVRGPQGLLFGRNTTGGAVIINTGNPTDTFEAKGRFAVETPLEDRGGLNTYAQALVTGPIVKDKLNGKIGVYYNNDDGYFKNLATGDNHGAADTKIIRGALEFFPSNTLTLLAKAEYMKSDGDGPASQNRGVYDRDSFDFAIDNVGFYDSEAFQGSLRADLDVGLGDGTITNILGYRQYSEATSGDIDSLPVSIFNSGSDLGQDQISNELRYNGQFGALDLTTGVYYFQQTIEYDELRSIAGGLVPFFGGGAQDHTVWGVFAQGDYDITEKLKGTIGLRYSFEEKDARISYVIPGAPCSVTENTCTDHIKDKNDWSSLTPKLGLQYWMADNTQIYGSYTKGFRSGGYNFRITDPANFAAYSASNGGPSFDQEEVDAYEIGIKHDTIDGRGQINAAIFRTEIKDMQRELNIISSTSAVSQFILNTADARISGLELEGRYAITDSFLVSANVGYIDAEYTDIRYDLSAPALTNINGGVINEEDYALKLPRVPKMTWGIGIVHDFDIGSGGAIVTTANFQHRDKAYYTDNNRGYLNPTDILNVNIAWNTPKEGVVLSLYGKNLLDEAQAGGDTQLPPAIDLSSAGGPVIPLGGTFSPLKKGALVGLELTIKH